MDAKRWRMVETVLAQVLQREPAERSHFLDEACRSDPTLRQEVESLLAADHGATGFLEPPAVATPQSAEVDLTGRLAAALADRYALERELGHGGMATVYLAHDLKQIAPSRSRSSTPSSPTRWGPSGSCARSASTARLDHPHILAAASTRAWPRGRLLYYVMPYVEGESLRTG